MSPASQRFHLRKQLQYSSDTPVFLEFQEIFQQRLKLCPDLPRHQSLKFKSYMFQYEHKLFSFHEHI